MFTAEYKNKLMIEGIFLMTILNDNMIIYNENEIKICKKIE